VVLERSTVPLDTGRHIRRGLVGAAASLALGLGAPTAHGASGPRQAVAAAVEGIRVDGVLDEPEWTRAVPIGALVQRDPVQGAAASEETEVRVVFDRDNLYFGVACRDRTPSAIVSTQLGRDADLAVDDRITLVLDPFFDQRNGFFFSVNPAGARADGQISNNEPEPSLEWDGIWDAHTRVTREGWVAEIAIPFKSLRFKPGQTTWGLNVERQIKRLDERDRWASPRFDAWISNLAEAGQLGGLMGLQQGRGLDIRPYVSGGEESSDATAKVGLDVSKSLTPSLTASLTVNTDFAETEVDARQINLTRFGLFFPEKRTFFLEGAGVYDVAGLGATAGPGGPPDLVPFFSRTIGLLEGQEVPILLGAKVSGRQSGFNIGVLDVQTRPATLDAAELPGQNLLAARVSRNFFEQSWVGAIVTHGDPTGAGDNTLIGVDARLATSRFRGGKNLSFDAFALRTDDGAGGRADWAYGARLAYPNDRWSGAVGVKRIGEGFRPALGFAPRTGIWKYDGEAAFQPRIGRLGIRQLGFRAEPTLVTNLAGETESWEVFAALPDIEFDSGEEIGLNWAPTFDRLTLPFEIRPGVVIPPGSYRWSRYQAEVSSATKRPWVAEVGLWWGGFYAGSLRQLESSLTLKPSTHLSVRLDLERNDVDLPEGAFVTQLLSARVEYSASPNLTWSNLVQYDSDSRILGFQSRFRWILRPGNDLFVVVSRGWFRRFDGDYVPSFDRGSAKLQYTIRL
jgi:hypothetical protein